MGRDLLKELAKPASTKIVLLVADGLGDIPHPDHDGKTPLEVARTPNLDALAREGVCGRMHIACELGVTSGSGPGHLGLFGYDPFEHEIGRGVMEAVGIGMHLQIADIAARGNFCTIDEKGIVTDRRAGRIATEKSEKLCRKLNEEIGNIGQVTATVKPSREHRFVVVFRGPGLAPAISDTDPQVEGEPIKPAVALDPGSERGAAIANEFTKRAAWVLADLKPANAVLLRGFSQAPRIQSMYERFSLQCACIAVYPLYKGLATAVGMESLEVSGDTVEDEFRAFADRIDDYDFFFIHVKKTDSYAEDGKFAEKVGVIEEVDRCLPIIVDQKPDVVCVTGDHSTATLLKSHTWHPVPVLIHSEYCGTDSVEAFTESNCNTGGLGIFESRYLMGLLLANALRLKKYGA
jgi:2,3-bisphosphoglycerate-independent phosphoglycerate mutase